MELVNALCPPNKGKSFSCLEASVILSPSSSSLKALSSLCLYSKVVAPMVVDAKALTEVVTSRWLKKVTVFSLVEESSMFSCFKLGFESEEDSEWALEQGPWSFKGYTFALRKWMPSVEGPSLVECLRLWWGVDSVSPAVALECAGPSSLPRPDGARLEKVGSRREVTVTSRGLPGKGPVMQRKKWTPKKVTAEREIVRGISGFGKKMNRNLNFGKRPPETFPRVEPLTMGDNVSNPLGISIPNKEDVSLKSVPPFAVKENLSFVQGHGPFKRMGKKVSRQIEKGAVGGPPLVGREVEALQVMFHDGLSGPPGPKPICVQKEKRGSDLGCGPDGKVNGGPGCLNSKEVGPGGSLIDSNNKLLLKGSLRKGAALFLDLLRQLGLMVGRLT
ncbi:hypothetical protein F8388_007286 [Cannabis sativa]|uniref:DUF4283 domain-containing protein n=1 Tax=Cannabis sativa TaxID=3483 RepID=A0A7J6FHM2_CANSA|nr:hypothetical protein F8388_007286 [Cannabis sativa]